MWNYCKNLLSQCNCTYIYKYLKEKTKTAQLKLAHCGLWKKKRKEKPNEQCCESVTKNIVDEQCCESVGKNIVDVALLFL